MPKTREDYNLETGLADDFDGAITDAFFEVNVRYAEVSGTADPMLTIVIETDSIEQPVENRYSCGGAKKWQISRNGKEVISGKNPDSHGFVRTSRAGAMVDRMFELVGGGNKEKGVAFFQARDRYMTEGEFYTDLNFHWKREPMKVVGSSDTRDILMPSVFLGEVGKKTVSAKTGITTTTTTTTAATSDDELDNILIELVSGKTEKEVKVAATRNDKLRASTDYMRNLISGTKLTDLEKSGKIGKGPDGKYI